MASPARPTSVSGPFGSAADLTIFSTPTTTRRADPARASETAARSSMAMTRSGPRWSNQPPPTSESSPAPYVPTSEGDVLTRIHVLLPKQPSPASHPSGQRRWRSTCLLSPSAWAGGCFLFPA
ncbi:hypothetical protein CFC21_076690 [Triticum aestivum]|uniref:Uncharacterized protein n=2 Tax=Triticum aestivum TaxID=4565 RepID=A0A3B6MN89_WHEAT|nr:hypothetical protein CFC21_076690 [Triticum aestivum]